jgi:hypothetical protein
MGRREGAENEEGEAAERGAGAQRVLLSSKDQRRGSWHNRVARWRQRRRWVQSSTQWEEYGRETGRMAETKR